MESDINLLLTTTHPNYNCNNNKWHNKNTNHNNYYYNKTTSKFLGVDHIAISLV